MEAQHGKISLENCKHGMQHMACRYVELGEGCTLGPGDTTAVNNSPVNSQRNADLEAVKTRLRDNKKNSICYSLTPPQAVNSGVIWNCSPMKKKTKVYKDVSKHINMILSRS